MKRISFFAPVNVDEVFYKDLNTSHMVMGVLDKSCVAAIRRENYHSQTFIPVSLYNRGQENAAFTIADYWNAGRFAAYEIGVVAKNMDFPDMKWYATHDAYEFYTSVAEAIDKLQNKE